MDSLKPMQDQNQQAEWNRQIGKHAMHTHFDHIKQPESNLQLTNATN